MAFDVKKFLAVGAKVRVDSAIEVPSWSQWDDDKGRTSGNVKKRMQALFFKGDKKITGEVVYVGKESERESLRRQGRVKIRLRDPSGTAWTITADPAKLKRIG